MSNEDLTVHEMHYDKDGLNLKLGGQTAMIFLQTLVELFEVNGGKNFLTMTVHKNDIKYAITIQNCTGQDTPSEKLERMEAENQRYKQALEEIKAEETVTTALSNGQVAYTRSGHIARQSLQGGNENE